MSAERLEAIRSGTVAGQPDTVLPLVREALADGVRRLNKNYKNYNPLIIRKWAEKFSRDRFRKEMLKLVNEICG